ncbi:ExbD/TolR family protein [Lysobacter terrae]
MATSMFAGDSRGTSTRAMAEMNITPLVDVMLVLLIIFMVAAPMATRSLDLRLPGPGQRTNEKPPHMALVVASDGSFALDGAVLSERSLATALANVAHQAPNTVLEVKVSENADYQAFTTAVATARRSGIGNIALQH